MDATQERRIDDQFPKRVNQCHVKRREQAYPVDIDREVESVGSRCLDQSTQRPGVGCPIDQLEELFTFETVDDAEEPISANGDVAQARGGVSLRRA